VRALLFALASVFWGGVAYGQEAEAEAETEAPARAWGPAAISLEETRGSAEALEEDRVAPDFDGREDPPSTATDLALAVPHLVLTVPYLAERYLLYPPIRAFAIWVEKNNIPLKVYSLLTIGTEQRVTFLPTTLVDFGFRTSIGLMMRGSNLGQAVDGVFHVAWGGSRWWKVSLDAEVPLGGEERTPDAPFAGSSVGVGFLYGGRPDQVFFGLGPVTFDERTRYFRDQLGGGAKGTLAFGHLDTLGVRAWVERNRFEDGLGILGDATIEEEFDPAEIAEIPGFDTGYTLAEVGFSLELDSRDPRPEPGTGARLELAGGFGSDVAENLGSFIHWGMEGALFLDVTGRNRTLSVRQNVQGVRSLGEGTVPFTERVVLGGNDLHRGFLAGELIGESATVTTLQYTWPVWVMLDGVLFAEVGNAFDRDFEGFALDAMRGSAGLGIKATSGRASAFHASFALGSTKFDEEFGVDSIRFAFGSQRGF
jgi:hypothetical protein